MGWSHNLIHVLASSLLIGCNAQSNTLGLSSGLSSFSTSSFKLTLVNASQTLYSLRPSSGAPASFDYIPYDKMTQRQSNGQYHLGDITFRVRSVGSTNWVSGDSAKARKAVTVLTPDTTKGELAAADLTPTLPSGTGIGIKRKWKNVNGTVQLTFEITNNGKTSLEIGSLGVPLEFNNIFTDRTAADTNANCSVFDPYIGQDAGYVQVTPLLGTLPPLVVTPLSGTHSPLEGWRFLPEDTSQPPYYQSQTFEGLYEWMFHTSAYATNEWSSVPGGPWNVPTSATLAAGETRVYGLEFRTATSIPEIDTALANAKRPVSVGVPGYIVPNDAPAKLFLKYGSAVQSISVSPTGALTWSKDTSSSGWTAYTLTPSASAWGRTRLTVTYADGLTQTVHYYLTASGPAALANLGNFLTTKQWFNDSSDPFGRSPSVISYDREVNAQVTDEARAWIAGLSDEAGAGSWLAAMVKSYAQPSAAEITKLESFVNKTMFKTLQNSDGTVKKSVYYYDKSALPNYKYPTSINWGNWWSWNKAAAYATDRAYDYVHVVGAYWAMYRVARNYPGLTQTTWNWYLSQAVLTIRAMTSGSVGYVEDGLMDESVILMVLLDLKREGAAWASMATDIESRMKSRAQAWSKTRYPFGSEMAWDSTGQEGVWQWANYFGDANTAQNTINSIIGYQPTVPHWGYNGNARRYWDNVYGGKLQRIERQIHHYGSGLNALPLLGAYRNVVNSTSTISASTFHLLRAGYGGASGALSNIDQSGFASASFHSFADTLKWDAYSGDYGPNLVGHILGTGTYILQHAELGWLAFGGVVQSNNATGAVVDVRDSVRRRVNVAGVGTFGMDAGVFERVELNGKTLVLTVLDRPVAVSGAAAAPKGRLVVEGRGAVQGGLAKDAGAWVVPFVGGKATVTLAV